MAIPFRVRKTALSSYRFRGELSRRIEHIVFRRKYILRIALAMLTVAAALGQSRSAKSNTQIIQALIDESIANYKGSCPCPYNTDRAGRSCGARSAYSRPGGASPICYAKDVTPKMIEDYRKRSAR
jgi:hypothetical protein